MGSEYVNISHTLLYSYTEMANKQLFCRALYEKWARVLQNLLHFFVD